jgi:hypothetical protein
MCLIQSVALYVSGVSSVMRGSTTGSLSRLHMHETKEFSSGSGTFVIYSWIKEETERE